MHNCLAPLLQPRECLESEFSVSSISVREFHGRDILVVHKPVIRNRGRGQKRALAEAGLPEDSEGRDLSAAAFLEQSFLTAELAVFPGSLNASRLPAP